MAKRVLRKTIGTMPPNERTGFNFMLAQNPNYFGNIPGSKLKPILKLIGKTTYEQLTCVGYNPDTQNMEATFSIKGPSGFSGNLCSSGSSEYIRFYLDFHDGEGFIDQGIVAANVHDIPNAKDCTNRSIFPLTYVATLKKKTPKIALCNSPILPTLRAILSWNQIPPEDTPNWMPVWGNIKECDVQLKPSWLLFPIELPIDLSKYLDLAISNPNLSSKEICEISEVDLDELAPKKKVPELAEIAKISRKLKIPPSRFAFKSALKMIKYPTSEITLMETAILKEAKINVPKLIKDISNLKLIDTSKANVNYEELECIGLDYNLEQLVATLKIKKKYGFIGDLCDKGSKEYISFWIDWDNSCSWNYLDTVELEVHDIQMQGDCLCYSVTLPLDTKFHKKLCNNPNIVRIRSVLSWNTPPSTTDPNKLEYYGNRVDAHIQIKPGIELKPGDVIPLFNIIGGIDVAHVNNATGLTKPDSFFAFNGLDVPTDAPFAGVIVLNGPSFPGYRYKVKVTNLGDGTYTYADKPFKVVGSLPHAPWVQYTTQTKDAAGYFHFLDYEKNTLNVLTRFSPGTNEKFKVELEVDTIPGVFTKVIQMDNKIPDIKIKVNDGGDCTYYTKGDIITGHYYVYDKHIRNWSFASTWGGGAAGTSNTLALPGNSFSIGTNANSYPCGSVTLIARDKTIVNSQALRHYIRRSYIVCLQEPE